MESLLLWMIRHHLLPICREYGIEGEVNTMRSNQFPFSSPASS